MVCQMNNVLIFGCNRAEHDARLEAALTRIKAAGITLNRDKCAFGQEKLQFLGHVVDRNGISADPSKVTAIAKMRSPENISELRRFLGMVNQLGKFTPNLATITQPLRELLSKKNSWCWTATQEQAFSATKNELLKPTVLALYNPNAPTKVQQTLRHLDLEQSCFRRTLMPGNRLLLLREALVRLNNATHRSRRRHLRQRGPVKSLLITSWELSSP